MTYRRLKTSDAWHWHSDCSNWPKKADSEERSTKPTKGELCNQCKSKEKKARERGSN